MKYAENKLNIVNRSSTSIFITMEVLYKGFLKSLELLSNRLNFLRLEIVYRLSALSPWHYVVD